MARFFDCSPVKQDLLTAPKIKLYGAFIKDGVLSPGWALESYRTNGTKNLAAMDYSDAAGGILAGDSLGRIYYGAPGYGETLTFEYSDGGSSPFTFETGDKEASGLALVSGLTYTYLSGGKITHGDFPVELYCGAMRCGRLFARDLQDGLVLRWSGEGGYRDWEEGISGAGSLRLDPFGGNVLNIFDFESELVIFREYSILRMSASGTPENFRVIGSVAVPPVALHTAAKVGDSILFFSDEGLMRYRGGKITAMPGPVTDDLTSVTCGYAYLERFYFVAGTSKSLNTRVVYVYDALCDCFHLIDAPAYFLSRDGRAMVAHGDVYSYRMYYKHDYIGYTVNTGTFNFGTTGRKLVTELNIDCDDDVKVTVSNVTNSRRLLSPNGRTRLNMRGYNFSVTITGKTGSVRSATLSAEVRK